MTYPGRRRGVLALLMVSAAALSAPCAAAQDAADIEPEPREDEESQVERRLRELEERDRERARTLEAALARVAELEARAVAETPGEAVPEAPVALPAEPLRPLVSMVTRFEHREGYGALGVAGTGCVPGDSDCIRYRARAGFQTAALTLADGWRASVRFLPQVAGFWAMPGLSGASSSGGVVDPVLGLHEGFLTLQVGDPVRLDVGRFEMAYGEHLIIGNLDWHPNARAFDGARLRIQPAAEGIWVDAFWTMLNEGGLAAFGQNDRYFYGAYANLGPAIAPGLALDAYVLGLQANESVDLTTGQVRDWSIRVTAGGRFRHRIDLVDLRAEAGIQLGRRGAILPADASAIVAGHVDGEVGLSFVEDRVRVAIEGAFASGDDPMTPEDEGWDQLFPTAHAFLGLSDVMGPRTNVATAVLHLTAKPIDQLQINLDWHVFLRPERGAASSEYAGTEGNLHAIWRPGQGLRLRGMYAIFIPNEGLFAGDDPAHFLEVELAYTNL